MIQEVKYSGVYPCLLVQCCISIVAPISCTFLSFLYYVVLFVSPSRPMGLNVLGYQSHLLQRCHPACGHEGSSHISLSPVLALLYYYSMISLSRCKFSTFTTRQPMVEFYLLLITFSRFALRTKEYKSRFSQESNSRFPH